MSPNHFTFIGFGAMDGTKTYKFIGYGAMDDMASLTHMSAHRTENLEHPTSALRNGIANSCCETALILCMQPWETLALFYALTSHATDSCAAGFLPQRHPTRKTNPERATTTGLFPSGGGLLPLFGADRLDGYECTPYIQLQLCVTAVQTHVVQLH